MSKVKIVGEGTKSELWVDNHMIGKDVEAYVLTHEAGGKIRLNVTYLVDELEVDANDVEVEKL